MKLTRGRTGLLGVLALCLVAVAARFMGSGGAPEVDAGLVETAAARSRDAAAKAPPVPPPDEPVPAGGFVQPAAGP